MTRLCTVKMEHVPPSLDHPAGTDWTVEVLGRSIQGHTLGLRSDAWREIQAAAEDLWRQIYGRDG